MKTCTHCNGTGKEPYSVRQIWHEDMRWTETIAYRTQKICTKCCGEGKIHAFTGFPKERLQQVCKHIVNNMSNPTLVELGRLSEKEKVRWNYKGVAAT